MADERLPRREDLEIGKVLSALADPHRRHVVRTLIAEAAGTERARTSFGLPVREATSPLHFRVPGEAGLL